MKRIHSFFDAKRQRIGLIKARYYDRHVYVGEDLPRLLLIFTHWTTSIVGPDIPFANATTCRPSSGSAFRRLASQENYLDVSLQYSTISSLFEDSSPCYRSLGEKFA